MSDNILALHGLIAGLKSTDKQALINIVNEAEANQSTIKTKIVNVLNNVSTLYSLDLTSNSSWNDILNAIPRTKTGKRTASGKASIWNFRAFSTFPIENLDFIPNIIILEYISSESTSTVSYLKNNEWYCLSIQAGIVVRSKPVSNSFIIKNEYNYNFSGNLDVTWIAIE